MPVEKLSVSDALNMAAAHFNAGQFALGDEICRQILAVDPANADALHLLALCRFQQGMAAEAVALLTRATELRPDDVELFNNLGNLHKALGDGPAASACYNIAIGLDHSCVSAHLNLARLLAEEGDISAAIACVEKAIELAPDLNDARIFLASLLAATGRHEEASTLLAAVLREDGACFEAQFLLGNIHASLGRIADALSAFRNASALRPDVPAVWNNLGVTQTSLGLLADARQSFSRAIAAAPDFVEALNNLGFVERLLGSAEAAVEKLALAVTLRPDYAEARRNLATTLAQCGRHQEALAEYKAAIELLPGSFETHLDLAVCYASAGDAENARATFDAAALIEPDSLVPAFGRAMTLLPSFHADTDSIDRARQEFASALASFERRLDSASVQAVAAAAEAVGLLSPFLTSYLPGDNKILLEQYGRIVVRLMHARYPQWSRRPPMPEPGGDGRLRVGVVSRNFSDHSDWKMITAGLLGQMDRQVVDLRCYRTGGTADAVTEEARRLCPQFVEGLSFEALAERISADNLHAIVYPEVGIDPVGLQLASLYLAPIQCCAWARPETSGLKTIDYFLSGDLTEPGDGEDHYSETLVRLPDLFSYYVPRRLKPEPVDLAAFGIGADEAVFLCCQSLLKYLPGQDEVFAAIAARLPKARFVFFNRPAHLVGLVKGRLKQAFRKRGLDADRHLSFLPVVTGEQFAGFCRLAIASLDSIGYSGCVTTIEAIEQGLPSVTLPGPLMRSRQTAAMFAMIGLEETVAQSEDEYVEIALRLALDQPFRQEMAARIADRSYLLYQDYECIGAFTDFIRSEVEGQLAALPAGG